MDASREAGGEESGFRPMQLLLTALGGCSTIDILLILKKQKQSIESFEVEVNGDREKVDEYSLFRNIELHFKISGEVDRSKAEKAIQLSLDKYCSVAKTLEPTAKITHKLSINGI
jgi:putative redox protein